MPQDGVDHGDEQTIRSIIERWFAAVAAGDLDGTAAAHSDDVVMYDVTGPSQATTTLAEYRERWPDFFAWQRDRGVFELVELSITAGADVAFAHALVRCGDADEPDDPARRLRITFGLRQENGQWLIAHEHHSGPDDLLPDQTRDEAALRRRHEE